MRYRLSKQAQTDLEDIAEAIIEDNPARAVSFVQQLMARFEDIADHPLAYAQRDDLPEHLRALLHGSYRIIYRLDGSTPSILRVLHAARDTTGIFR